MRWIGALLLSTATALPSVARADTVSILPDADTTLYSEDDSLSNGAGDYVFAGRTDDGSLRRALLSFDVAGAIPAGATVTGVTLNLYLSRTRTVDRGKYRFRVLNGSNARTFALSLSNGDDFLVIGNDGGLLEAPVTVSELTLAPGERAEIVIDFAGLSAGDTVDLVNGAAAPYPGTEGVVPDVMRFVVGSATGHTAAIPSTLRTRTLLDEADTVEARDRL